MDLQEKLALMQMANVRRGAISDEKGPEYTGEADRYAEEGADVLANFKRQDVRWGFNTHGLSSAFVYFGKHLDSIETFGREVRKLIEIQDWDGAARLVEQGEGIISRLDDARNYLDLIECLLWDATIHPLRFSGEKVVPHD